MSVEEQPKAASTVAAKTRLPRLVLALHEDRARRELEVHVLDVDVDCIGEAVALDASEAKRRVRSTAF